MENEIIDGFIWNSERQRTYTQICLQNLNKMAKAFAKAFNKVHKGGSDIRMIATDLDFFDTYLDDEDNITEDIDSWQSISK